MAQLKYNDGNGWIPVLNFPLATDQNPGIIKVQNNLITTETGSALDATQGKILQDEIEDLKDDIIIRNTFSTNEHRIGTWVDGKPIYSKTIYYPTVATQTGTTFSHGIANIKYITYFNIIARDITNGASEANNYVDFNYSNNSSTDTCSYINRNSIFIRGTGNWTLGECYITINYTKTTDY